MVGSQLVAVLERIPELTRLLDERFGVDALWVFGSVAAGSAPADSDLGLAGLFRSRPDVGALLAASVDLAEITGREVDLVDLERASPILAMQVRRHGRIIHDLTAHVVANEGLGTPSTQAEGFTLLQKHGVIAETLACELRRMTGFHNLVVHRYAELDASTVDEIVEERLEDLGGSPPRSRRSTASHDGRVARTRRPVTRRPTPLAAGASRVPGPCRARPRCG